MYHVASLGRCPSTLATNPLQQVKVELQKVYQVQPSGICVKQAQDFQPSSNWQPHRLKLNAAALY